MLGIEEKDAILRVYEKGILSGYKGCWDNSFFGGEEVKELEKEWAKYFNVKHAIACNSATSGIEMACAAIGLKPYLWDSSKQNYQPNIQEVLVTPYSMSCSASIPLKFGANPVFVDIEEDYFCMDSNKIEEKITEYTKAIIVVDLFGMPYDVEKINAIAKKHNLYVIEDAAQAIGATYKNKYAGTFGDIGVYSLNVHKHIQCGEGGMVVTDNDILADKLRLLMNHSETVEALKPGEHYNLFGNNYRMTEIAAAITREQLKKLDKIINIYRENAKEFPIKIRENCQSSYYKYAYTDNNKLRNRTALEKTFNFKKKYVEPIYKLPLFKSMGYEFGLCPVCENVNENINIVSFKEII